MPSVWQKTISETRRELKLMYIGIPKSSKPWMGLAIRLHGELKTYQDQE
jgi:hypothetical protein